MEFSDAMKTKNFKKAYAYLGTKDEFFELLVNLPQDSTVEESKAKLICLPEFSNLMSSNSVIEIDKAFPILTILQFSNNEDNLFEKILAKVNLAISNSVFIKLQPVFQLCVVELFLFMIKNDLTPQSTATTLEPLVTNISGEPCVDILRVLSVNTLMRFRDIKHPKELLINWQRICQNYKEQINCSFGERVRLFTRLVRIWTPMARSKKLRKLFENEYFSGQLRHQIDFLSGEKKQESSNSFIFGHFLNTHKSLVNELKLIEEQEIDINNVNLSVNKNPIFQTHFIMLEYTGIFKDTAKETIELLYEVLPSLFSQFAFVNPVPGLVKHLRDLWLFQPPGFYKLDNLLAIQLHLKSEHSHAKEVALRLCSDPSCIEKGNHQLATRLLSELYEDVFEKPDVALKESSFMFNGVSCSRFLSYQRNSLYRSNSDVKLLEKLEKRIIKTTRKNLFL